MRVLPLIVLVACARASEIPEPVGGAPVRVRTVQVERASLPRPVHGAGKLKSAEEVTLSFPSGGVVTRLEVEAGDRVARGQLLAILDAAPARAQLDGARSAMEKAERDFQRAQALEGTALARQQREDATTGLQIAQANVQAAEFAVRRSALVAPADGVVISRFTDPNQTIGAGAPVLKLSTDSSWELEIAVPAADALRIEPGLPAKVRLAAYGESVFAAQVVRRAGGAGGLGTWLITLALDPTDHPLASGLVGSADLAPASEVLPVVPLSALAEVDGARGVVYTVGDGVARRVPVQLAFFADDRVALAPPLDADEVVDVGTAFVRDGAAVTVVPR